MPGAQDPVAPGTAPSAPPVASQVFGSRRPLAEAYAALLADTGVTHGLIGPREIPRLWERHLLNCAVIEDAFPHGASVIDVGSGAGLPGIVLAIARPDLRLRLVEPMLRRTTWLEGVVAELALENVVVDRGRAEELAGQVEAAFVTARAVARIDKLARWTLPLVAPGGSLIAMKGSSAAEELAEEAEVLSRLGAVGAVVTSHGADLLDEPTWTIDLVRGDGVRGASPSGRRGERRRGENRGGKSARRNGRSERDPSARSASKDGPVSSPARQRRGDRP